MKASYVFDETALNLTPGLVTPNNQRNAALKFTLGDMTFTIEPTMVPGGGSPVPFEVPAKVLRVGGTIASGLTPVAGGAGPNEDFLFLRQSAEYSYTTRLVVGGGVVEKIMPAGAQVGDEGRMILYKGATLAQVEVGGWTERLVRPFTITAADLANRQTGWPASGAAPTVDIANKKIVDGGGDGYNHI